MSSICLQVGLLLSVLQWSHQSCQIGNASECNKAGFPPGINLAGEGFDITKMARKGAFVIDMNQWQHPNGTCTLCANPFLENLNQKLPLPVVDWRPNQQCKMHVSSSTYRSSEDLVTSTTSLVDNNWKAGLDVSIGDKAGSLMLAGTNSKLAKYAMEKSKRDKFSFTSHSMACEYYSYRLTRRPKLHREFEMAVKDLPETYSPENKRPFYKLLDTFGTHYITQVKLGGSVRSVTSIPQCEASLQGFSVDEVEMCLQAEASLSISVVNLETEMKRCKKDGQKSGMKSSFSSLFSDRFTEINGGKSTGPELLFSADKDPSAFKEWLASVPQLPDLITYSLDPLHELLPAKEQQHENLRLAINHYILEKALNRTCSDSCQVGSRRSPREPCACTCQGHPAVTPDCCPARRGMARVVVTVQRGSGLWGDDTTATDGFVRVSFGVFQAQTPIIWNNDNPHWDAPFYLGEQDVSTGRARFEVWDQDNTWDNDLLGECERELSAGVGQDVCNFQYGRLYFTWEVTCAPSLGGRTCMDYIPSPMGQHLQKAFVSRHAQRVSDAFLRENGVFVGASARPDNQSAALSAATAL